MGHGLPFGVRYEREGCEFAVEVEAGTKRVWVRLEHPWTREVRVVEMAGGDAGESGDEGVRVWRGGGEGVCGGWCDG